MTILGASQPGTSDPGCPASSTAITKQSRILASICLPTMISNVGAWQVLESVLPTHLHVQGRRGSTRQCLVSSVDSV